MNMYGRTDVCTYRQTYKRIIIIDDIIMMISSYNYIRHRHKEANASMTLLKSTLSVIYSVQVSVVSFYQEKFSYYLSFLIKQLFLNSESISQNTTIL